MISEPPLFTYSQVSLDQMTMLAIHMADLLLPGDTLFLKGPLGAGKTTFASALIQHLMGEDIPTPSPTFALIHPYDTPKGPLWHVDLYRLTTPEVPPLGLEEHWSQGITLIEWPERLPYDPPCPLHLIFDIDPSTEKRHLSLKGKSPWPSRLTTLL